MAIFAAPSEVSDKRAKNPDALVVANWAVKPGETWLVTPEGKLVITEVTHSRGNTR